MARKTVEGTRFLDIQQFTKLKNGIYSISDYEHNASITVRNDYVAIGNQQIYKTKTKVGYGERTWFICPICDCNTKRIYKPTLRLTWACRKCQELTYTKSQLSGNKLEYIDFQIRKIQSQFDMTHAYQYGGLPGCIYEQIPLLKPRYMRWERFYELQNELKRLINKRIDAWVGLLKL